MLEILNRWNRWGTAKLSGGFRRTIVDKLLAFINTSDIVALTGLRRVGKTTILYQLMDILQEQGIPSEAMLHINFEEPALGPKLNLSLLDELYSSYREEIYPKGKAYIFLDEIQNIPDWERWVRARNESEDIKIFITGSSANLMSRELATVLTGRHVNFHVSPLSFAEFLQFKQIEIPNTILKIDPPAQIQHALKQYLDWGGLPEIVLSQQDERRRILLKQYFDDLLFKDVAMRHQIRDLTALRNIAVHLMTQTACLISMNRVAKVFNISLEMASNYCHFIQESFLVDFIPFYSLKSAERVRNPQKVHACDLGLRQIASLTNSPDYGKLTETVVYQYLQQQHRNDIFYWKATQEVDFVLRKANTIHTVIQVAYDNLDDEKVFTREFNSLLAAQEKFTEANSYIIVNKMPKMKNKQLVPLWYFLLRGV